MNQQFGPYMQAAPTKLRRIVRCGDALIWKQEEESDGDYRVAFISDASVHYEVQDADAPKGIDGVVIQEDGTYKWIEGRIAWYCRFAFKEAYLCLVIYTTIERSARMEPHILGMSIQDHCTFAFYNQPYCEGDGKVLWASAAKPYYQCPWCKSGFKRVINAHSFEDTEGDVEMLYYVECDKCLARGPSAPTELDAITRWNGVRL